MDLPLFSMFHRWNNITNLIFCHISRSGSREFVYNAAWSRKGNIFLRSLCGPNQSTREARRAEISCALLRKLFYNGLEF